ncbi:hypothetical protein DGMP_13280 [Desulfomarina profundi]|uniref:Uncharacterized protein n=1 Tax=Desulfomarina profundi TaxID=2772557 RepID=A0A8D5JNX6_9BACT|nr:hypothetical protein DGMP_13280 [Desulfomarina profundi]
MDEKNHLNSVLHKMKKIICVCPEMRFFNRVQVSVDSEEHRKKRIVYQEYVDVFIIRSDAEIGQKGHFRQALKRQTVKNPSSLRSFTLKPV